MDSSNAVETRGTIVRATLAPVVAAGVLLATMLSGPGPAPATGVTTTGTSGPGQAWKQSYSERYPGCVSVAVWPAEERPVAVIAQSPDGDVERIPTGAATARSGRIIGACR